MSNINSQIATKPINLQQVATRAETPDSRNSASDSKGNNQSSTHTAKPDTQIKISGKVDSDQQTHKAIQNKSQALPSTSNSEHDNKAQQTAKPINSSNNTSPTTKGNNQNSKATQSTTQINSSVTANKPDNTSQQAQIPANNNQGSSKMQSSAPIQQNTTQPTANTRSNSASNNIPQAKAAPSEQVQIKPPQTQISSQLKHGQLLQAVVTTPTNKGATNSTVQLQIGKQLLLANTDLQLKAGDKVNLRVDKTPKQITLRILDNVQSSEVSKQSALRTHLPRQQGLPPLLANLQVLVQGLVGKNTSPNLRNTANELIKALPRLSKVSNSSGVRNAIHNSGVFLESKLLAQLLSGKTADTKEDIKGTMLKLLQLLKEQPEPQTEKNKPGTNSRQHPTQPPMRGTMPTAQPRTEPSLEQGSSNSKVVNELRQQTEAALSRLQLSQVASTAAKEPDGVREWLLELPVQHEEKSTLVQMRIRRDPNKNNQAFEEDGTWSVMLALNSDHYGELHSRITLSGENVMVNFWAEQKGLSKEINNKLEVLQASLRNSGLNANGFACYHGTPPDTNSASQHPPEATQILDITA